MNRNKKKASRTGVPAPIETAQDVDLDEVVDAYAAQAQAADQLAQVDTTHLDTPYANPAALDTLNTERTATAREKIALDFERERLTARDAHQVLLDQIAQRRHRATAAGARSERAVAEGLADADEATAQLATIREFEAEASPAAAATALTRAVRGWRKEEFANAIVGSALSAVGIAALLVALTSLTWWTAPLVAVAAEVVLTMRVVRLISQRATLAERHKGSKLSAEGRAALVFMGRQIIALLAVSVLVNIAGLVVATGWLGLIGVLGAVAAAVSSVSAARVSVAVTETVRSNVQAWQGGDWERAREELRTRAAGAHIPTPEDVPARDRQGETEVDEVERVRRILAGLADEQIAALADRGTDALAAMLNRSQPPTEGGTAALAQGPHAPTGTPSEAGGTPGGTPGFQGGSTVSDQHERPEPTGNCLRVLQAITDPANEAGVRVTNTKLAEDLELSRTAVRKHRTWLWSNSFPVHPEGFKANQSAE
ncbi:hypothetical protein DFP74_6702 [Nocardiopsis sp. Huas11]|uniref:hypothetical protein n=1 Tax=Nocardiopsis sp. Huas11 TaxID=2183912 RepID=UPI000EB2B4C9|nr:hypothetical protein [Nocardiopsis sp. Huas11]RKR98981.1 hypothetical protein DFP74_6702 [Nocardiopsis sp. Huas11]